MDLSFLLTLFTIFVIAAIGALLKTLALDKVLKDFNDYHVTLEGKTGKRIWGRLQAYSSGLEFYYSEPVLDAEGHLESSYILYKDQFGTMFAIYRHPEALSRENQKRRLADLEQAYRPGWGRRLWRRTRNILNNLRDALMQTVGIILGQMKTATPGKVISKTEQQITALSQDVIGYAGNAYDPILERHINRQVVLEVTRDGKTYEYAGLLKEYSSHFLEVLDVKHVETFTVQPRRESSHTMGDPLIRNVSMTLAEGVIMVGNATQRPLKILKITGGGVEQAPGLTVEPSATVEIPFTPVTDDLTLTFEQELELDLVVPRTHALIQHSAEELYYGQPRTEKQGIDVLIEKIQHRIYGDVLK